MHSEAARIPRFVPLVIIPCLNEAEHIARVVSQMRLAIHGTGGKVVVVDGGSTDGTFEIAADMALAFPDVALLPNPARLQGPGINAAVRAFGDRYTHLVRIDAHCDYPEAYVATLARDADETHAAAVVVGMVAEGEALLQRINASTQNSRIGNGGSDHRRQGAGKYVDHGHHALIRLDAFREVGGYDEAFSHNEDAEFDYRLAQAGHRIWLTGRTHITYYPRRDVGSLARQYFNYGQGRAKNLLKHAARPKLRQLLVIVLAPFVLLAFLAPVAPLTALPALLWAGAALFGGLALALAKRQSFLLLSGPVAMLMHLSWSFGFWTQVLTAHRQPKRPVSA